jgi:2-iminobutanoate/2-iminopropanoate deaminase
MSRRVIKTPDAPIPVGTYSQAVTVGHLLFSAGQIGINPKTNELLQGSFEDEVRQVIYNLQAVLAGANMTLDDVIKFTVFMTDLDNFGTVNKVLTEYFPQEPPARSAVEVAGLPKNARIEIECIASAD